VNPTIYTPPKKSYSSFPPRVHRLRIFAVKLEKAAKMFTYRLKTMRVL